MIVLQMYITTEKQRKEVLDNLDYSLERIPKYIHLWDDGAWTSDSSCFKAQYPNMKEVNPITYFSPLYKVLNG